MLSTGISIVCSIIAISAYIYTIFVICKKIKYIERILHQDDRMMQLLQFQISLLDAELHGDEDGMKKIKEEFSNYCADNNLFELNKINNEAAYYAEK